MIAPTRPTELPMFVFRPDTAGTVVALLGQAVARAPDGRLRMLSVGDRLAADEVVLTARSGQVQLDTAPEPAPRAPAPTFSVARPKLVALASIEAEPAVVAAPPPASRDNGFTRWTPEPETSTGLQAALRLDGPAFSAPPGALASVLDAAGATAEALAPAARSQPLRSLSGDRYAPQADAGQRSGAEDTAIPVALTGRDIDGALARVIVVKVPTGGLLYRPDGVPIQDREALSPEDARNMVFVPAPHFHGNPGPLQYLVEDMSGRWSSVVTVRIDVRAVNDAPVPGTTLTGPDNTPLPDDSPAHIAGTADYRWATAADAPLAGRINATDVDGDALSFRTATAPAHGALQLAADGGFVYTPEPAWRGSDRFVVSVDDGRGGRAESVVTIDVGLPHSGPAAAGPMASEALASPIGPLNASPLSFDEIFGRDAALASAAQRAAAPVSDVEADVLQLSSLLLGHRPGAGWAADGRALDLGLDPWAPHGAL